MKLSTLMLVLAVVPTGSRLALAQERSERG